MFCKIVIILLAQFIRLYTKILFSFDAKTVRTTQIVGNSFEILDQLETLTSEISILLCIDLQYGAATAFHDNLEIFQDCTYFTSTLLILFTRFYGLLQNISTRFFTLNLCFSMPVASMTGLAEYMEK